MSPSLAQPGRKIIDLTYSFSEDSIYWPNAESFQLTVDSFGPSDHGFFYAANSFSAAEHGGTHLDAPIHFAEGMPTVDELDLNRLIGPAVLIDISGKTTNNPDYLVTIQDFENWEKRNGRIPDDHILLLRTGWGQFYPDKKKYLGTDLKGPEAIPHLHFPGLDPVAADWLVQERKILAIGLDTASIDYGQSVEFKSHQILFKAGIPAFENVANLEKLPEKGFQVIALPMKIKSGSGGPLRIIAVLED